MPGILRVALYYGPDRREILSGLDQIDVLVASYHTLSYDYSAGLCKAKDATAKNGGEQPLRKKFKSSSIFSAQFHRIILDEARK